MPFFSVLTVLASSKTQSPEKVFLQYVWGMGQRIVEVISDVTLEEQLLCAIQKSIFNLNLSKEVVLPCKRSKISPSPLTRESH
jgi:hypothetical protein